MEINTTDSVPSAREFWQKFVAHDDFISRPAIFRGLAHNHLIRKEMWTDEYLKKHYGDEEFDQVGLSVLCIDEKGMGSIVYVV